MAARTRNSYAQALSSFCNWCVETGRLAVNPLAKITKADEAVDRRRHRRAMTETELMKLLDVARRRPLADYGRRTLPKPIDQRKGKRDTWMAEQLTAETFDAAVARATQRLSHNPELVDRLDRLGRERAMIYKTLVLTGLRRGELASITVAQVSLVGSMPYIVLHAADEKGRRGADVPLRPDLAADLRAWLDEKLAIVRTEAFRRGEPVPDRLPDSTPLFTVPDGLVRILDRDLIAAGIPKRDERGRTIDVHALRHTFGTLLSKGGVAPRTAQAAMRHSKIDLTMNVYTDPKLLDVAGALNSLPTLPLDGEQVSTRQPAKATGTDDYRSSPLAPVLAPTHVQTSASESFTVKMTEPTRHRNEPADLALSACPVNKKRSLSGSDNERHKRGRRGSNPQPLDRQSTCRFA